MNKLVPIVAENVKENQELCFFCFFLSIGIWVDIMLSVTNVPVSIFATTDGVRSKL